MFIVKLHIGLFEMHSLVALLTKKLKQKPAPTSFIDKTSRGNPQLFVCPECGNPHVVHHYYEGYYSCTECGAVTAQNIVSEEQEWREFEEDPKSKSRSRVGGAIDDDSITLSTRVRGKASAKIESDLAKANVNKAKLQKIFKTIDDVAKTLQLLQTVKKGSKAMFKELFESNAFVKKRANACVAAVIYKVAKDEKAPIDMNHLVEATKASKKEIKKAVKSVERSLAIKQDAKEPIKKVQQVSDVLNLGQSVVTASRNCIEQVYQQGYASERTPSTIAATVLVLVLKSQNEWTAERESQIATELNVSKKVISDYLKELIIYQKQILPSTKDQAK